MLSLFVLALAGCGGGAAQQKQKPTVASKPRVIVRNGKIETLQPMTFEYDSDKLTAESQLTLDEVAEVIKAIAQDRHVRIEGYCDERGDDAYNLDLSVRRARAVRDYLVTHGSIAADRLDTEGHGRAQPIADNATEEGRARNRRVEFILVQ